MSNEILPCAENCPWNKKCFELHPGCLDNIKNFVDINGYAGVRPGETKVTVVEDGVNLGCVANGQYIPDTPARSQNATCLAKQN